MPPGAAGRKVDVDAGAAALERRPRPSRRRVGDRTGAPVIAQRAGTCRAWPPAGPKQSGTAGCSRLCVGGDGSFLLGARLPLPPARPAPAAGGWAPGGEGRGGGGGGMGLLRAFRRDRQAAVGRGPAGCSRLCVGGDGSFLLGARLPLPPARPAPAADGRAPGDEGSVERGEVMSLLRAFRRDIQAALERDPAARHWLEVLLVYPGVHA